MNKKTLLIWMGSLILLSGLVNVLAICLLSTTVSHVTGLFSYLAIALVNGDYPKIALIGVTIAAYLVGTIISGIITERREFLIKKRYGWIVTTIGIILYISFHTLSIKDIRIAYILAFTMGLQNGMIMNFKGIVVRLTHMTGNLTDLGVHLGYMIKGNFKDNLIPVLLPFFSLLGFVGGGALGLILYMNFKNDSFDVVALTYIFLGCSYLLYQFKHSQSEVQNNSSLES